MHCKFASAPGATLILFLLPLLGGCKSGARTQTQTPVVAPQPEIAPYDLMVKQVKSALLETTGQDLGDLEFIRTDLATMRSVLAGNLAAPLDEGEAASLDDDMLDTLASGLVGIYDFAETKNVYICPDSITTLADLVEVPELDSEAAMFAILAHEGAHASADRQYGLQPFLEEAFSQGDNEALAANAVIEGYAQHLARIICTKHGNTKGFEDFTRALHTLPEIEDASERVLREMSVAQISFSYLEGETFVNAVFQEQGRAGIDKIFQSPPTSKALVERPGWYLHPETRPVDEVDFEASLAVLEEFLEDRPDFRFGQRELSGRDLSASMGILGRDKAQEAADLLVRCYAKSAQSAEQGGMVVVVLMTTEDETKAARYVELSRELSDVKDEAMKDPGQAQITKSILVDTDASLGTGFEITKTVLVMEQDILVNSFVVHRANLVAETLCSNGGLPEGLLREITEATLDRAQGLRPDTE